MRQNFEFNLRILGNIRIKTQKSTDFGVHFQKTSFFLDFLIKIILFTIEIYILQRKMPKVWGIFRCKKFENIWAKSIDF